MIQQVKPDPSKIPGFYEPKIDFSFSDNVNYNDHQIIKGLLNLNDCDLLIKLFEEAPVKEAVSVQGLKDVPSDKGSERTTMWSEELAHMIFKKLLKTDFRLFEVTDPKSRTECYQHLDKECNLWELHGVSPLLRFMSYEQGGEHYAHYDAGFIYPDTDYRTMKSFVIYLTTNASGPTRFINDGQDDLDQKDRKNDDWDRSAHLQEIIGYSYPDKGNALIFDHRLCHDVGKFEPENPNEKRMIIRGDLIYKRVNTNS